MPSAITDHNAVSETSSQRQSGTDGCEISLVCARVHPAQTPEKVTEPLTCIREAEGHADSPSNESLSGEENDCEKISKQLDKSAEVNHTDRFSSANGENGNDVTQRTAKPDSDSRSIHRCEHSVRYQKWRCTSNLDVRDDAATISKLKSRVPNDIQRPLYQQDWNTPKASKNMGKNILNNASKEKHDSVTMQCYKPAFSKEFLSDSFPSNLFEVNATRASELDFHFKAIQDDKTLFPQENIVLSSEASHETKSASENGLRSWKTTQRTSQLSTGSSNNNPCEYSDSFSDQQEVSCNDAHDSKSLADLHGVDRDGKVDITLLPILKNPLQKAGRHTVIRGRLADDHPFSIGAFNLGHKLVSKENFGRTGSTGEPERRTFFAQDLRIFLKEIGNGPFKIPVIGGGDLDLFLLAKEVMLLGGVQNVVRKRAFRIVAQQLGIPKTCTSAASVLKGAYERLLFHYEQRLVFGKWPDNPGKAVNMKERVFEEKVKERESKACMQVRSRRKGYKSLPHQHLSTVSKDDEIHALLNSRSEGISCSDRLAALALEGDPHDPFRLPCWAQSTLEMHGISAMISATQKMSVTNIQGRNEAVLFAVAECFESCNGVSTSSNCSAYDMCLGHTILSLSADSPSVRKTKGFFFNLLAMVVRGEKSVILASNESADRLLEGFVKILGDFQERFVHGDQSTFPWKDGDMLPFSAFHNEGTRQAIAQTYCVLTILSELANAVPNKGRIFLRKDIFQVLVQFLRTEKIHHTFATCILTTIHFGSSFMTTRNHGKTLHTLTEGLLDMLEESTAIQASVVESKNNADEVSQPAPNFTISGKALSILSTWSPEWELSDTLVQRFMKDMSELLFLQHRVDALEPVVEICLNLAAAFPKLAGSRDTFVSGILQVLHSGVCLDFAVETLCHIHTAHSLDSYKDEIREVCRRQLLSDTRVHSLSELLNSLMESSGPDAVSSCVKNGDVDDGVMVDVVNEVKSKSGSQRA